MRNKQIFNIIIIVFKPHWALGFFCWTNINGFEQIYDILSTILLQTEDPNNKIQHGNNKVFLWNGSPWLYRKYAILLQQKVQEWEQYETEKQKLLQYLKEAEKELEKPTATTGQDLAEKDLNSKKVSAR